MANLAVGQTTVSTLGTADRISGRPWETFGVNNEVQRRQEVVQEALRHLRSHLECAQGWILGELDSLRKRVQAADDWIAIFSLKAKELSSLFAGMAGDPPWELKSSWETYVALEKNARKTMESLKQSEVTMKGLYNTVLDGFGRLEDATISGDILQSPEQAGLSLQGSNLQFQALSWGLTRDNPMTNPAGGRPSMGEGPVMVGKGGTRIVPAGQPFCGNNGIGHEEHMLMPTCGNGSHAGDGFYGTVENFPVHAIGAGRSQDGRVLAGNAFSGTGQNQSHQKDGEGFMYPRIDGHLAKAVKDAMSEVLPIRKWDGDLLNWREWFSGWKLHAAVVLQHVPEDVLIWMLLRYFPEDYRE